MTAPNILVGFLLSLTPASAAAFPAGVVQDRPGGLLPSEELPGEARAPGKGWSADIPRTDGGWTRLVLGGGQKQGNPTGYLLVDLTRGTMRRQDMPQDLAAPWARLWGPDGRLYFGLWGPAAMLRYDPDTDTLESLGIIEPEGKHISILGVGADDKVYGIANPWGHVFAIDPQTRAVTRYGRVGPAREYIIAYTGSIGADDDWICTTYGNVPAETWTFALNKQTRQQVELKDIRGAMIVQRRDGVQASLGRGPEAKWFWLYRGRALPCQKPDETPPWPAVERPARKLPPKGEGKLEVDPASEEPNEDGLVNLRYRFGADQAWRTVTYTLPLAPHRLRCIGTLPDGRVYATSSYAGIWTWDPATQQFQHLTGFRQSTYSVLKDGTRIYLSGYPGGTSLFVWDTALPWTAGQLRPDGKLLPPGDKAANPRQLEGWVRTLRGFQHPWFTALSADRTLFAAVHGERANVGGVLAWRELDSGNTGILREPFELYEPHGLCAALNGTKIVYAGTAVKGVAGEPRPTSGRLFVIDARTRQLDGSLDPIEGVDSAGLVVESRPGVLLLAVDRRSDWDRDRWKGTFHGSLLYEVDLAARKVTRCVEFPGLLAGRRDYLFLTPFEKGPDGQIYTFYDEALVRIDPQTLAVTRISLVADKPSPGAAQPDSQEETGIGRLAFLGRDIYLSGASHFRRVTAVLPTPP